MPKLEGYTPVLIRDDVFAIVKDHCRSIPVRPRIEMSEYFAASATFAVRNPPLDEGVVRHINEVRLNDLQAKLQKPNT